MYLLKANVKLSSIYNYFQSFMDKFISPFYFDSVRNIWNERKILTSIYCRIFMDCNVAFISFNYLWNITTLNYLHTWVKTLQLLKYFQLHGFSPSLQSNLFIVFADSIGVLNMCILSSKMSLELLYYFWEMYILENDS